MQTGVNMPNEPAKKPVIFVGLPCYGGQLMAENAANIERMLIAFEKSGMGYYTYRASMADVVDTRNCMLTVWYDKHPESEYLLMIDNDMVFSAEMVFRMFMLNKPVVGAIYSKKHFAPQDKNGKVNFWEITVGEPLPEEERPPVVDGFQLWKYVGGGILMIRRDAVTKLLEKFPEINDTTDPGFLTKTGVSRVILAFDKMLTPIGRHLSEDYSFCERWRQCDGEIWGAVGWTVGHRGLHTFEFHPLSMLGLDGKEGRFPNEEPKPQHLYVPTVEHDLHNAEEITWLGKQIKGAKSILEIGSAAGQSLRYLSASLSPGAIIRSVDLGEFPAEAGQFAGVKCESALRGTINELCNNGFDADVFIGDSHSPDAREWAKAKGPPGGKYDLVFIDGDHTYAGVRQDYETFASMGQLVALHDIVNPGCEVPKLWQELKGLPTAYSFVADKSVMGIGVVRNADSETEYREAA
jgi:hypothetical protein